MKMNIFDKIDNYYENKEKKEFYYTIIGIFLLIGFIVFYFIAPKTTDFSTSNEKKFKQLKNSLNQNRVELQVLKIQNIRIKNELKNIKQKLITLNKNRVFYSQLADLLDFAHFNKEDWAQFVKSSIIDAKSRGLDVKLVKNIEDKNINKKEIKTDTSIIKKMNFGLNLEGQYKNFIYYMYKYENIKPLIRVDNFQIKAPDKFYIEFSLYGYKQ